jgi:hypothetical protein
VIADQMTGVAPGADQSPAGLIIYMLPAYENRCLQIGAPHQRVQKPVVCLLSAVLWNLLPVEAVDCDSDFVPRRPKAISRRVIPRIQCSRVKD